MSDNTRMSNVVNILTDNTKQRISRDQVAKATIFLDDAVQFHADRERPLHESFVISSCHEHFNLDETTSLALLSDSVNKYCKTHPLTSVEYI